MADSAARIRRAVLSATPWVLALLAITVASLQLAALDADAAEDGAQPAANTPLLELGRNVQWIRFQRALLRGEDMHAVRMAESAVALDPMSTESWELLASHLAVYRASPERELDLGRRRAWFRAGVAAAERGEASARDPDRLLVWRGMLYLDRARLDPELLPGGPRTLLEEALRLFRLARERAAPEAELLEAYVLEELAKSEAD